MTKRNAFYCVMVTASLALAGCAPEIASPSVGTDTSLVPSSDIATPSPGLDTSLADSADSNTPVVSASLVEVAISPLASTAALTLVEDPLAVVAMPPEKSLDQGAVATSDLRVPAGYSFKQTYDLEVVVANSQERVGYLSVCSDFSQQEQEQGYAVNYANCQLRAALEGDFAATLELPNNVNSIIAVVWYFDTDKPAAFAVWEKDDAAELRFDVVL
jgi:hypothetical protein